MGTWPARGGSGDRHDRPGAAGPSSLLLPRFDPDKPPGPAHRKLVAMLHASSPGDPAFNPGTALHLRRWVAAGDAIDQPGQHPDRGAAWAARLATATLIELPQKSTIIAELSAAAADAGACIHTNSWHLQPAARRGTRRKPPTSTRSPSPMRTTSCWAQSATGRGARSSQHGQECHQRGRGQHRRHRRALRRRHQRSHRGQTPQAGRDGAGLRCPVRAARHPMRHR